MDAVFLGMNDAGENVYDWLNSREDVKVIALLTEKEQLSLIKELEPEIVVSSGFEHKVPEEIIEVPDKGIVNLHPSYLPYNRGAHPYIWPIVEDTPAGVSVHYMSEEIDEGDIIDRKKVEVRPDDTAKTLRDRLMEEQTRIFIQNWGAVKEGAEGTGQNPDSGTTHYRGELDEFSKLELDEEKTVGETIDKLRALTYPPQGLAYFERDGERFIVDINITPEKEIDQRSR